MHSQDALSSSIEHCSMSICSGFYNKWPYIFLKDHFYQFCVRERSNATTGISHPDSSILDFTEYLTSSTDSFLCEGMPVILTHNLLPYCSFFSHLWRSISSCCFRFFTWCWRIGLFNNFFNFGQNSFSNIFLTLSIKLSCNSLISNLLSIKTWISSLRVFTIFNMNNTK